MDFLQDCLLGAIDLSLLDPTEILWEFQFVYGRLAPTEVLCRKFYIERKR